MARQPKPWFRKDRKSWFVTVNGHRHNLGPDKKEAFERFYALMRQPVAKKISSESFAAIADAFLDWTQQHRSGDTYEWYRSSDSDSAILTSRLWTSGRTTCSSGSIRTRSLRKRHVATTSGRSNAA